MESTLSECPNCKTKLKTTILGSVKLLDSKKAALINEFNVEKSAMYCDKCGYDKLQTATYKLEDEISNITEQLNDLMWIIPVITLQHPHNWEYSVIKMVTAQTTTGTGVFAEFASSFTDLFGLQSGTYNKKLRAGEQMCFTQLRQQSLDCGGNAVIATDIDYSEVGGDKGMLMVCMSGTAVNLKNIEILGSAAIEKFRTLDMLYKRHQDLLKLKI